ncbi:MAG: 1-acyl-sn-glycerol-3-phosphate acyltransferase [SAR202 cluster bacterium]|nr:1-acyl-sn-glycerol-3-phosphate acyltransferase [SAR202 cluster bacterium]
MIYRITWLLLRCVFRLFFRWRVLHPERVPASGPVLLAANHESNLDPPAVAVGISRPCASLAKEELFRHPLFGWYLRRLNAFPVRRGEPDRAALQRALEYLNQGWPLIVFPEGTRSDTGELREAELGIALLAYRTGAPVVPVCLHGTRHALPRGGKPRRFPFTVTYGEPLRFSLPEGQRARREEYSAAAAEIMAAIARLRESADPLRSED